MKPPNPKLWWFSWMDSLSAANLLFVPFWLSIFVVIGTPFDGMYLTNMYFKAATPTHLEYLAALLLTLLVAVFIWGLGFRRQRLGSQTTTAIIGIISLVIAANAVRIHFFNWFDLGWIKTYLLGTAGLGLAVAILSWYGRRQIQKLVPWIIRICFPLFLLTVINVGVAIVKLDPERLFESPYVGGPATRDEKSAVHRVVWIIFDELDERVGFQERPDDIEMPALDQFRRESIVATNTKPPGGSTVYSMPTLMIGRYVQGATYPGRYNLRLHFPDGEKVLWTEARGILHQARANGMDVALLGQGGHPYCRQFGELLGECREYGERGRVSANFWDSIGRVAHVVLMQLPFVKRVFDPTPKPLHGNPSASAYFSFLNEVRSVLIRPEFELVILHWNLPHRPFFYDRKKNDFVATELIDHKPILGYLDNLELTDIAFSEMRRSMIEADMWNSTAIIVSADHVWRQAKFLDGIESRTVPMMIKLPNQKKGEVIETPLDAAKSRFLIWGLLTGVIGNAGQVEKSLALTD
ncbi:MAG: hypothetical protein VX700_06385 [Pseudomonadota bacterium]|nr:hypothetical protein [Pseudomonadota bacterium]